MHIEHFLQTIGGIGMKIGFECAFGLPVQIVVLLYQSLEFLLDLHQLIVCEFVVVELHLRLN